MLRASVNTLATSFALALVALANTSVTARGLGVEGRGLLGAAMLVLAIARGISLLGLGEAYVQSVRSGRIATPSARTLYISIGVIVAAGAVTSAAGVLVSPLTGLSLTIAITVVAAGFGAGMDFIVAATRVEPGLRLFNALRLTGPILATGLVVAAWAVGRLSVDIAIGAQALSALIVLAWGAWGLSRHRGRSCSPSSDAAESQSVRNYLMSGAPYQGIALVGLFLNYAHMTFVMLYGTLTGFGLYAAAYGLSRMISPIQMSIGNVVYANRVGEDRSSSGAESALRALRLTLLPTLLIAALAAYLSDWVVQVVLGKDFRDAAILFAILIIEAAVSGAGFILGQHLQAIRMPRVVLIRNMMSVIPLVGGVWFIPTEHIPVGVALLMLASASARLGATLLSYRRTFPNVPLRLVPRLDDLHLLLELVRSGRART